MDSKFDLYVVPPLNSEHCIINVMDIVNSPKLQNKDITFKVIDKTSKYDLLRGLYQGSIQLVGYFDDNCNLDGYTNFTRISDCRCKGVCLINTNVDYPYTFESIDKPLDYVINRILEAIEFFNCLTYKIN